MIDHPHRLTHFAPITRRSLVFAGAGAAGGALLYPVWAMASNKKMRVAVVEHRDNWTGLVGAAELLKEVGFETIELDPSVPADQQGVDAIVLGSFSCESKPYKDFMTKHAKSIPRFVEAGGVVLQFTQADQHEPSPPFLPEGLEAHRTDFDPENVVSLRYEHPLLSKMLDYKSTPARVMLPPHKRRGGWEAINRFKGFAVLAAENEDRYNAVLLEGAHGKGRYLISALHFDKLFDRKNELAASKDFFNTAKQFATNFREYVAAVKAKQAPEVLVDEPYKPAEPIPYTAGAWTLAVLPDTQIYTQSYPQHFDSQTKWIADQAEAYNIKHVLHLGDVVNRGMIAPDQWKLADKSMSLLEGRVPFGVVPGNHDYDDNWGHKRVTHLNKVIPPSRLAKGKTLKELYQAGRIDNQLLTFEAEGQKWLMLGLEFGPRDEVLAWAKKTLNKYKDHHAIVFTHAYMYFDGTRYDHKILKQSWNPMTYKLEGSCNDAEMMWKKALKDAPNVRMVLSGHVLNDGLGYLLSKAAAGHSVHQMLSNYQTYPEGGDGYMRLYEFQPDGKTVQAKSYSPVRDKYKTDPANQFRFVL